MLGYKQDLIVNMQPSMHGGCGKALPASSPSVLLSVAHRAHVFFGVLV